MTIAVDFDGTIVTHEYPNVGVDIGAWPILRKIADCGHRLILFTMRDEAELRDAVNCCREHGVIFSDVNRNQVTWSHSPKVYADLYIDDLGLGIPLRERTHPMRNGQRYVDWQKVTKLLVRDRIIPYARRCQICGCADDDCRECFVLMGGSHCEWTNYKNLCSSCVRMERKLP